MATKAKETEKAVEAEAPKSVGRAPSAETLEFRKIIKRMAFRKNGVTNIDLAAELGVTTLKASALANQLLASGDIEVVKDETNGRVTYVKAAKAVETA